MSPALAAQSAELSAVLVFCVCQKPIEKRKLKLYSFAEIHSFSGIYNWLQDLLQPLYGQLQLELKQSK